MRLYCEYEVGILCHRVGLSVMESDKSSLGLSFFDAAYPDEMDSGWLDDNRPGLSLTELIGGLLCSVNDFSVFNIDSGIP